MNQVLHDYKLDESGANKDSVKLLMCGISGNDNKLPLWDQKVAKPGELLHKWR